MSLFISVDNKKDHNMLGTCLEEVIGSRSGSTLFFDLQSTNVRHHLLNQIIEVIGPMWLEDYNSVGPFCFIVIINFSQLPICKSRLKVRTQDFHSRIF